MYLRLGSTTLILTSGQGLSENQLPGLRSTRSDKIALSIEPVASLAGALGIINQSVGNWKIILPGGEKFTLSSGVPTRLVDGMMIDFGGVQGQVVTTPIVPNDRDSRVGQASAATLAAEKRAGKVSTSQNSLGDARRSNVDPVSQPSPTQVNLLLRVWRGQVSLPITYWVWGTLGGAFVGAAAQTIERTTTNKALFCAAAIASIAWQVFVSTSIFRSGGNYAKKKNKFWGRLAQVMALLGIVFIVINLSQITPELVQIIRGQGDLTSLDADIASENARLPQMLNKTVRLDSISREKRVVLYQYTILGPTHVPSSQEVQKGHSALVADVCKNSDARLTLSRVDKIRYTYRNDAGSLLYSTELTNSDCR